MVRADAMAAVSTTRRNRDARSVSIFSPNVRAFGSGLVFVVAMSTSIHLWARPMTINQPAAMRKLLPLLLLLVAPAGVFGLLPECLLRVHDFLTTSLRMKITHRSALEQAVARGPRPQLWFNDFNFQVHVLLAP